MGDDGGIPLTAMAGKVADFWFSGVLTLAGILLKGAPLSAVSGWKATDGNEESGLAGFDIANVEQRLGQIPSIICRPESLLHKTLDRSPEVLGDNISSIEFRVVCYFCSCQRFFSSSDGDCISTPMKTMSLCTFMRRREIWNANSGFWRMNSMSGWNSLTTYLQKISE